MEKFNVTFDSDKHIYTLNGQRVYSVSQILLEEGFINTQWFTDEGRSRGAAAHKAIELHCRGAHCFRDPVAEPYLDAFKQFQKDCEWVPHIIEEPMACPQYSGTADQFGHLNGHLAVLDFKSGAISVVTGLQLVAYEKLYNIYFPENKLPMKRIALQLTNEGKYKLTEFKDRTHRYIWDSIVAVFHFKKNNKIGGRNV